MEIPPAIVITVTSNNKIMYHKCLTETEAHHCISKSRLLRPTALNRCCTFSCFGLLFVPSDGFNRVRTVRPHQAPPKINQKVASLHKILLYFFIVAPGRSRHQVGPGAAAPFAPH